MQCRPSRSATLMAFCFVAGFSGQARADCSIASFQSTQILVENFLFRQDDLLRDYPRGGDAMRYRVSVIAASSKAALPVILRLVRTGNIEQRQAAGGGLALAARMCDRKQQALAARFIEKTAKSYNDPAFLREFDKYYKSKEDIQIAVDEGLRAQTLRDQTTPAARGVEPGTALGRSVHVPLDGKVAPIQPVRPTRPLTR